MTHSTADQDVVYEVNTKMLYYIWDMCMDEEDEESNTSLCKHHVQSSVKWADIEKGIPPQQHGNLIT